MAILSNKWTNPLRRSFQAIKNDMLDALDSIPISQDGTTLVSDKSEGNILVLIISLFSAIAETLHFYIDNMARECFISTARRYESVANLGLLVDYHPKGANAATIDVILTRELDGVNSNSNIRIPKGTVFLDSSNRRWESVVDVVWASNTLSVSVPLIQHELYTDSSLNGTTLTDVNSLTLNANIGDNFIEHNSIELSLNDEKWAQVDTFAYSKPTDKHFRLSIDESNVPTIVFGDGKFGAIPTQGATINISYYITAGERGNIYSNSIVTPPSSLTAVIPGLTCNNPYSTGDGMNYEDISTLRRHIPLQARTMGLAVTKQDFIDCAKLVTGVKEAAIDIIGGRKFNIYISPIGGGIASDTLVANVKNYLDNHSQLGTWSEVYPAMISRINLNIEVTGKPSFHKDEIHSAILNALYENYSSTRSQIGGKVRISDIYALIDNLPQVDYLYIKKFYVSPWPKIIYGDKQLALSLESLDKANGSMKYIISFEDTDLFSVYSVEGRYELLRQTIGNITIDDTINGFNFSLAIGGTYSRGFKYEITISEPNHDYEEPGFNQVVFDDASLLTLDIKETV